MPQLFTKDIALVQQFFESMCKVIFFLIIKMYKIVFNSVTGVLPLFCLKRCHGDLQEEADVRLAIQEALSMMVGAYANLQGALLNLMEALVAAYIVKVGRWLDQDLWANGSANSIRGCND